MINGKTFTGIILARGGSKGIKLKNIKPLGGKPLVWWTIKAAKDSGIFDQLYVSTENTAIKSTAWGYGINVINRPLELASDTATSEDAIAHALSQVNKTDYAVLLEPTHPFLSGTDLRAAADLLIRQDADAVLSVIPSEKGYCAPIEQKEFCCLSLKNFIPKEFRKKRRQDLGPAYYIGGGIYITKWDILANAGDFFDCDSIAYILPFKHQAIDIDTYEDLQMAEAWIGRYRPNRPSFLEVTWRVLRRLVGI